MRRTSGRSQASGSFAVNRPAPSPVPRLALIAGIGLVLAGGVAWWMLRAPPGPSPSTPTPPVPTTSPTPSVSPDDTPQDRFQEARKITTQLAETLNTIADDVIRRPHQVKPPYPWKSLPDTYRRLMTMTSGRNGEVEFWLDHCRALAVPFARASEAVSRDPDDPDAPKILTVASENQRGRDFDQTVRRIGDVVKPRPGDTGSIHALMQAMFYIVSGDTKEATVIIDRLPPLPDEGSPGSETPTVFGERVARVLARALLAYGVKKGDGPLMWTRRGLKLLEPRLVQSASVADWEWALILAYATLPSFFHEDYGGRKEAGPDVVDEALELIGLGRAKRPQPPRGLDPEIVREVRFQVKDAGKRGIDQLGPGVVTTGSDRDLELGCRAGRWQVLASHPEKDEGKIWYGLYMLWLTQGKGSLARSRSPKVKEVLEELDQVLAGREPTEKTGVMCACRARIAQIRGDVPGAQKLLARAQEKLTASGLKEKDESVAEAVERFAIELRLQASGTLPSSPTSPAPAPSAGGPSPR